MFGWLQAPAADPGDRRRFVVDSCADCGHALLREPPAGSAAERHATGGYASPRPRMSTVLQPILRLYDRAKLRMLRRAAPPGSSVLEVGAGRGRFVVHLADAGYGARGIEPAPARVETARAAGADVAEATIEDADIAPGSVDAVVAWHVLEHTDDAGEALARIAGWLRPGGALLLGVPNRASWQASIGRDHWFHLDLPRHINHFTPDSLGQLLDRHGMETVAVRHIALEHNPYGMWQTLINAVTFDHNVLFGLFKRSLRPEGLRNRIRTGADLLITLVASLPALVVALPLELAAGSMRRGGTISVLAVKGDLPTQASSDIASASSGAPS